MKASRIDKVNVVREFNEYRRQLNARLTEYLESLLQVIGEHDFKNRESKKNALNDIGKQAVVREASLFCQEEANISEILYLIKP